MVFRSRSSGRVSLAISTGGLPLDPQRRSGWTILSAVSAERVGLPFASLFVFMNLTRPPYRTFLSRLPLCTFNPRRLPLPPNQFLLFCGARCYVALGTRLRLGMHVNGPERHIISSKGFAGTALARRPFSNASAERRGSRRLRALWPSSLDRLRRKRL